MSTRNQKNAMHGEAHLITNSMMLDRIIARICFKDAAAKRASELDSLKRTIERSSSMLLGQVIIYRETGFIKDDDLPKFKILLNEHGIETHRLDVLPDNLLLKNRIQISDSNVIYESIKLLLIPLSELKESLKVLEAIPLSVKVEPPSYSLFLVEAYKICEVAYSSFLQNNEGRKPFDSFYMKQNFNEIECLKKSNSSQYFLVEVLKAMQVEMNELKGLGKA